MTTPGPYEHKGAYKTENTARVAAEVKVAVPRECCETCSPSRFQFCSPECEQAFVNSPAPDGCNCTGFDHRQSCPEWVLPY